jgi:surface antigen
MCSTKTMAAMLLMTLTLVGCETTGAPGPKTTIGGLGGAAAGGLLAAALGGKGPGIAGGVILGGLLGGAIGSSLDAADQRYAAEAAHRALETTPAGASVAWQNPDSGHSGTITPTRTYRAVSGQYCREYQQEIMVGGQRHQAYGTACRQPDGSWQIMS